MKYYIYKIKNIQNNKVYIGLTNNIARRRNRHFTDLRCGKHDNSFLQKEFDKYGENSFIFEQLMVGDYSDYEIGELEKKYICEFNSFRNGYNQNEGGNFGVSNGGSHLVLDDLLKILAVSEFMNRSGSVLAKMFDITKTTVSRINKGVNHVYAKEIYESLSLSERKQIFDDIISKTNIYEEKLSLSKISTNRKLSKKDIFLIWVNEERKIFSKAKVARILNVKSVHTLNCILNKKSYNDYTYEYFNKLSNEEKDKIAVLLSDK